MLSQDQMTILIAALAFAVTLGPLTARSTIKREPLYGGFPAHLFNFLGSMGFVALLPSVLAGLLIGAGLAGLPVAIVLLLSSLLFFMIAAIFELPARKRLKLDAPQQDDEPTWTEANARQSGL